MYFIWSVTFGCGGFNQTVIYPMKKKKKSKNDEITYMAIFNGDKSDPTAQRN